jgi:hypothetical protein
VGGNYATEASGPDTALKSCTTYIRLTSKRPPTVLQVAGNICLTFTRACSVAIEFSVRFLQPHGSKSPKEPAGIFFAQSD